MEEAEEAVDVLITDLGGSADEAIAISVLPTATLASIKEELAELFERPEIVKEANFVKQMPNGATVTIHDLQKLGTRRELLYQGPPLRLPSEAPPPVSLAEFDGLDDRIEVQSPRSLRAMDLQGVSVDELYYAPVECFWEPGLDDAIINLHHDFFEAFRQDSLAMVKAQRERIVEEEGEIDESWAEQSNREWMVSVQSNWSKGRDDATTREPSRELSAPSLMPKYSPYPKSADEEIAGLGGNWAGVLEPYNYPMTNEYLEGIRLWTDLDKVYERPLKGSPKDPHATKSGPGGSPAGVYNPKRLDLDAPGLKARKASAEIETMVKQLKSIPREQKRPQVGGLVLNTHSVAVVQRRKNAQARSRTMGDVKNTTDFMISVASAQKKKADEHHKDVIAWRDHREACSQESRGKWQTTGQETNFANAYRRADHWHERRAAVHQAQLDAEATRSEANIKRCTDDIAVKKRVANIRDLTRIKFARSWLDRRIRWAKCEAVVAKANDAFKTSIMNKHAEAQARVHDRNIRLSKFIEFKREYKSLRRLMQRLCEQREQARQETRRLALVGRLESLAEEAENLASRQKEAASSGQDRKHSDGEDDDELQDPKEGWQSRRPLHLSMSTMSATSLMQSTDFTSPAMKTKSRMTNSSTPLAQTPTNQTETSWLPKKRSNAKRFPRFDFGRFGAESLTLLSGPQLHGSTSLPNLAV